RGDERVHDLEALDRALLLLALRGLDRLAQRLGLRDEVEVLEQLADGLSAHAALEVDPEAVRGTEAVLELAEDLLVVDDQLRLALAGQLPGLLETAGGGGRGLPRVLLAGLDVLVGLAHLDRPLDDRVEVLLGDLPVCAQAEVVGQVAQFVRARPRLGGLQRLAQELLAQVAGLLELLLVDARDEVDILLVHRGLLVEQAVEHALDVLGDRALLGAGRLAELLVARGKRLADLDRGVRDRLQLLRREAALVADRRIADELADLLRVLRRDLVGDLDEHLPDELAHLLERRHALLLGPVREAAAPEVVVLVEVALGALGEVGPAPLEPILERGEVLVAVDVDLLRLGLDLVLQVVQVLLPGLGVDRGHDRGGEVQDLLELARRDVEQVADAARDALEEPDVRDGRGQVDVAHALAPHLLA